MGLNILGLRAPRSDRNEFRSTREVTPKFISAHPQFSQRLETLPEAGASCDTADPDKGQRI
jgi:hypothetical protein